MYIAIHCLILEEFAAARQLCTNKDCGNHVSIQYFYSVQSDILLFT